MNVNIHVNGLVIKVFDIVSIYFVNVPKLISFLYIPSVSRTLTITNAKLRTY